MQATRHLLTRATRYLRAPSKLVIASAASRNPLPSSLNMCIRKVSGTKCTGQLEKMDRRPDSPSVTVATAKPSPSTSMLKVSWGEGGEDVFPYVWLRDNCTCSSCFHPTAFSRLQLVESLQFSVTPDSIQVADNGGEIKVSWSDGHESTFSASWLHERAFNLTQQLRHERLLRLKKNYWGSELAEDIPRANFEELMEEDEALLKFLQQLEIYGLIVVSESPKKLGQLHRLSERVTYLSRTHYGKTFIVESKPRPSNLAYTSSAINLHSDLSFCFQKPSIQLLHCIKQFQGKGGENLVSDGFHAAHRFRIKHPDKFHLLASTLVEYCDNGNDNKNEFMILNRHPIIRIDSNGELLTINFHHMSRHSFFNLPAEEVISWYDAMLTFHDFLQDPKNCIQYKMADGDILVLDNIRVLHARMAFEARGERLLEGGYWDWTSVSSKRRLLEAKLGFTHS